MCFAKALGELVWFPGLEESPLGDLGERKNTTTENPSRGEEAGLPGGQAGGGGAGVGMERCCSRGVTEYPRASLWAGDMWTLLGRSRRGRGRRDGPERFAGAAGEVRSSTPPGAKAGSGALCLPGEEGGASHRLRFSRRPEAPFSPRVLAPRGFPPTPPRHKHPLLSRSRSHAQPVECIAPPGYRSLWGRLWLSTMPGVA